MAKFLISGSAGFVGFHLAKALLEKGDTIVGLDNINNYYDVNLKFARLKKTGICRENIKWNKLVQSQLYPEYRFIQMNLEHKQNLLQLFATEKFDFVINLAAQAGVRYSIENPDVYIQSNIVGFFNILEACRIYPVKQLIFASSSSVYGNNTKVPFSETDNVDCPISLYAATKKSNELMAYSYSHLYKINTIGIRLFTVYGPWGRPDMALFKFTKAILEGKPIQIYNQGELFRDFTYIDDIVNGIILLVNKNQPQTNDTPYNIYNIGNNKPIKLLDFIAELELCLRAPAKKEFYPMQAGDVKITYADISKIVLDCSFHNDTILSKGLKHFCKWYFEYYGLK